ncbi:hypothetical protein MMC07_004609 [Pseudocyphellaria aurata]|nr:hypothetical protein [Pseudocyphellaria aurata]
MASRKPPEGVVAAGPARSPGALIVPEGVGAAGPARSPGTLIVPEGVGANDAARSPGPTATAARLPRPNRPRVYRGYWTWPASPEATEALRRAESRKRDEEKGKGGGSEQRPDRRCHRFFCSGSDFYPVGLLTPKGKGQRLDASRPETSEHRSCRHTISYRTVLLDIGTSVHQPPDHRARLNLKELSQLVLRDHRASLHLKESVQLVLHDHRAPTATAARLPRPKELVIDMVDGLVPTEATGRGQRVQKRSSRRMRPKPPLHCAIKSEQGLFISINEVSAAPVSDPPSALPSPPPATKRKRAR